MMTALMMAVLFAVADSTATPQSRAGTDSGNILKNVDMTQSDGLGGERGTLGWTPWNSGLSSCRAKAQGGGIVAFEFFGAERCYFRQTPLTLKSGGRYRMGAEVRTSGLNGMKAFLILLDPALRTDVKTKPFPDDTHGEWQRIEWSGKIMDSARTNGFVFAVSGDGGGATSTVRFELRNLELVALDAESAVGSAGLPPRFLEKFPARIVPIDPLLAKVSAADARMLFYWPGDPAGGVGTCVLSGSVDGGPSVRAALGADGRAQLAFGTLAAGEHRMSVRVDDADGRVLATNDYRFVACPDLPQGPSGRRLNNFATELVAGPLRNGDIRFFRPTEGFVWVSFDGANDEARGTIDGESAPCVLKREGEIHIEGVRRVSAGWHTLGVSGATRGRLRIHAVGIAAMSLWPVVKGRCNFSNAWYRFSSAFARRFLLSSMNVVNNAHRYIQDPKGGEIAYYRERGFGVFGDASINWSSPAWLDAKAQWEILSKGDWASGYDISVDESQIGAMRSQHVIFAENVWRMYDLHPERRVNIYWGDATQNIFDDPKVHVSELAAIANTGNGTGISLPETYAPILTTPEAVDKWLDLFAREAKSVVDLVPGAREMTLFNVSPWIDFGHWSDYPCPEADAKAMYARMLQMFATRPECAFTCGVASGGSGAGEEEIRRWQARLFRYHVFEGGTENLADRYGYKWTPGFVANCDFADGLRGWTVKPASGGSVTPGRIDRYGARIQRRNKAPAGTGDSFAEFTAADAGPNAVSQRISGLRPGGLYALMFCVAGRENVEKKDGKMPAFAFHARLEGARELRALRFRHMAKNTKAGADKTVYLPIYRYVFRAESETAELVLEDRGDDGARAPAGLRQIVNYVVFRPYYVESPEEADEIGELMRE